MTYLEIQNFENILHQYTISLSIQITMNIFTINVITSTHDSEYYEYFSIKMYRQCHLLENMLFLIFPGFSYSLKYLFFMKKKNVQNYAKIIFLRC